VEWQILRLKFLFHDVKDSTFSNANFRKNLHVRKIWFWWQKKHARQDLHLSRNLLGTQGSGDLGGRSGALSWFSTQ